ncbi:peptidase S58 family protein [Lichenibacterium minor]|uniref:Peptidase S58 family protein n=1 Tax=Lichenibacterium minor TaxID=2316528 RepID=A0A4Q2U6I1_9HYPH|nr:P1 family peptidase [Lichenibacterium minor]RYC31982.1 peptidase S58 family protein [Lichenibacterium minor]
MRNLVTDVPGLRVGHADDAKLASGLTAIVFDRAATASIAIHGGAPGVRDTALLEPEMTVEAVDAIVLSGGSAFGLDGMGGAMAALAGRGRGFAVGAARVPIVPGAVLFDLANGGDKAWGRRPPYWEFGHAAVEAAALDFALGSVGAGLGATTADLKGGLGSASAATARGFVVGALAAVNALGQATVGDGAHFWASPYERGGEFGGLGLPAFGLGGAPPFRTKGTAPVNTTVCVVATDAALTKAQCKRLAVVAQGGLALALRPAHAALDGDVVFAAATGSHPRVPTTRDLTEIGALAAETLARAVARGVYEAAALPFPGAMPSWRDRFARA